jgi:hypothetical protein
MFLFHSDNFPCSSGKSRLQFASKPEATVLAVFTGFLPPSGAAFHNGLEKRQNHYLALDIEI